ncbi:histidinol dehydrogenase [Chloroflexota bacterium]
MKIIEGYQSAKAVLSRQVPTEFIPVSPGIRQGKEGLVETDDPEQVVRQIIDDVRNRGDNALRDYTLKFDGIELTSLEVSKQQVAGAYQEVDSDLVSALRLAAERIRSFHLAQRDAVWGGVDKPGLGQLIRPLERIGAYVPGGTACYPSTVLMTAIPARIAGVKEIILVTPPGRQGTVPSVTLVAADIAQVDRIFCVGGAQSIAALTFGTESIPRVDKICGPGNIFVVLAKKLVGGIVAIDGLQGPSEVLIVADETANPEYCAADLLAQAEHDSLASPILVTTSRLLADRVNQEVERQLASLPRKVIAAASINNRGVIAVVTDMDEAMELANLYAPEHLCLAIDKADTYVDKVSNAGCVFIGGNSPVVLGDYVAGPSHVLPTGGTARFSSPLNITDFIKFINLIAVDEAGLKQLGQAAATIARAEGFDAHARAVEKRLKSG